MKKLIFLHIPKTAGQSVHQFLVESFGQDKICPARVNQQIKNYTIDELNTYQVFSGHIDWEFLDHLKGEKYIFTILRSPKDRILSFYHYLRSQASKLSPNELNEPERQGMKAILEMTPDEYFCSKEHSIRGFIDNHYDNFYTYYFATKRYDGRGLLTISSDGDHKQKIFQQAINNLSKLDKVYLLETWGKLKEDLQAAFPDIEVADKEYFLNVGDRLGTEGRLKKLQDLGATDVTFKRIEDMCSLDNHIYQKAVAEDLC